MNVTLRQVSAQAAVNEARERAYAMPIETIDVSRPEYFRDGTARIYFERLRAEAPVHYCPESRGGAYWSVTKYKDIMAVDTNHGVFSSSIDYGGLGIQDGKPIYRRDSFIAMDQPRHADQRKTVQPMFRPQNLDQLEQQIRERACKI